LRKTQAPKTYKVQPFLSGGVFRLLFAEQFQKRLSRLSPRVYRQKSHSFRERFEVAFSACKICGNVRLIFISHIFPHLL
jgi:hypothetical protein